VKNGKVCSNPEAKKEPCIHEHGSPEAFRGVRSMEGCVGLLDKKEKGTPK